VSAPIILADAWLVLRDELSKGEEERIGPIRVRVDGRWAADYHACVIAQGLRFGAVELAHVKYPRGAP